MDSCNYVEVKLQDDVESVYTGKPLFPPAKAVLVKKVQRKSRCSCCNICLCLGLFSFGFGFLFLTAAYMYMSQVVRQVTVEYRPNLKLNTIHIPEEELEVFKEEAELFFDNLGEVDVTEDFVVTETNLNGLAAASDFLKNHVYTHMNDNEVRVDISMPTDVFPGGKGRYFVAQISCLWKEDSMLVTNGRVYSEKTVDEAFSRTMSINADDVVMGQASFHVDRNNDKLEMTFKDGYFEYLGSLFSPYHYQNVNILADLYESTDDKFQGAVSLLSRIEKVSLEDGKVVIQTKK